MFHIVYFSDLVSVGTLELPIIPNFSTLHLLRHLHKKEGYKVYVLSRVVYTKQEYNNFTFLPINLKSINYVNKQIDSKKTVIYGHPGKIFVWSILFKLISGAKLILRTGGVFYGKETIKKWNFKYKLFHYYLFYKISDYIISTADTTPVDLYMKTMGVPAHKYSKWLNGFPKANNNKTSPISKENIITCISRLSAEKNVDYVIESFAKALPELNEKYILQIGGDGPELDRLRLKIKQLHIEEFVEFMGFVTDSVSQMKKSKLIITGLANNPIIEGIVAGIPLINLDLGETKELYGQFSNVYIVDYPFGGYGKIPEKYYTELVNKTSSLVAEILNNYKGDYTQNIDYNYYGWECRNQKEIKLIEDICK